MRRNASIECLQVLGEMREIVLKFIVRVNERLRIVVEIPQRLEIYVIEKIGKSNVHCGERTG